MAARSPTTWTTGGYAFSRIVPTKIIRSTEIDRAHDDLEYFLDAEQLGISACFEPFEVDYSVSGNNWIEVYSWDLELKDWCDVADILSDECPARFTALVWSTGALVRPDIRVSSGAGANTPIIMAGTATTTPTWTAMTHNQFDVQTNEVLDTIKLELRVGTEPESGKVYCAGFGLFVL